MAQGSSVDARGSGPVLLLTALDCEYLAVRSHLTALRRRSHPAGTLFETGRLPSGGDVAIAVAGEGNPAVAVLAERAITAYRPRALVFVGVAGALREDIGLGDVVVATKIYAIGGGKVEGDGFLARPRAWHAPHELEQLARAIYRTQAWVSYLGGTRPQPLPEVHFKPIASGEVLLNARETPLARQLRRSYNDAVAIEMESAGAAQAAELNGLPVLTVRGISDTAAGGKQATDRDGWQHIAAGHAAAFAVALASELTRPGQAGTDGGAVAGTAPVPGDGGPDLIGVIRHRLAGYDGAAGQLERAAVGQASAADLAALRVALEQVLAADPSFRAELAALAAAAGPDQRPQFLTVVAGGGHVGKIANFGQVHGDVQF